MKTNRRESGSVADLFLKKLKKEHLPKRDVNAFLKEREARKKLEREAEKLDRSIEEIEAPIYKAQADSVGISLKTLLEIQKKRSEAHLKARRHLHKNPIDREFAEIAYDTPVHTHAMGMSGVSLDSTLQEWLKREGCKDITIQICKEQICVEQEMPTAVDDIYLEGDGSLNRIGNDRFQAGDSVGIGTSSTVTHEGKITILSGAELVEPTTILGVGFDLEHPRAANGELIGDNCLCGWGLDPWIGESHWGRAIGYWQFKWLIKEPGKGWTTDFVGAEIKYHDTGKIDSYVMCWATNVLGQRERARIHCTRYNVLPAGTEVLSQLSLRYWIKAKKTEGHAWSDYSLRVKPFIKIHACSLDYPDSICINVSDYI